MPVPGSKKEKQKRVARSKYPERKLQEVTSEKLDWYIGRRRLGFGVVDSCKAARLGYETVRQFREANPEFEQRENEAAKEGIARRTPAVVDALYTNATQELNVTAQQVWLYNRLPDEWKDKRNADALPVNAELLKEIHAKDLQIQQLEDKIQALGGNLDESDSSKT